MGEADAFVIVGKVRRGPRALVATLLIGAGFASVGLFGAGLLPAYDFEREGSLPDAAERCPERIPSEQGFDGDCVRELVSRGPLYLGKELLAGSFLVGASALSGALLFDRRSLTRAGAALFLTIYFSVGWALAFYATPTHAVVQGAYLLGLAVIVFALVLAGLSSRQATMLLSIVYAASWIGLLVWNVVEADRHLTTRA